MFPTLRSRNEEDLLGVCQAGFLYSKEHMVEELSEFNEPH